MVNSKNAVWNIWSTMSLLMWTFYLTIEGLVLSTNNQQDADISELDTIKTSIKLILITFIAIASIMILSWMKERQRKITKAKPASWKILFQIMVLTHNSNLGRMVRLVPSLMAWLTILTPMSKSITDRAEWSGMVLV